MKKKILFIHKKKCKYSKKLTKFISKKIDFLTVSTSNSKKEIYKLCKKTKYDYLILFRSHLIIDKKIIVTPKFGAINFHPSTPNYRGVGGVNYAILNGDKYFGSTAHYIDTKIDHGTIIDVKKFLIKNWNLDKVYSQTLNSMYLQAKKIILNLDKIDKYINKSKNEKWSNRVYKRKDLNKLYLINLNLGKSKIEKQILATYSKNIKPYILINKVKFEIIKN